MTVSDHAPAAPSATPPASETPQQPPQQPQQTPPSALKASPAVPAIAPIATGASASSSPLLPAASASSESVGAFETFDQFLAQQEDSANRNLAQVSDVTGVHDRETLINAFNKTKRVHAPVLSEKFSVTRAIEWILDNSNRPPGQQESDPALRLPDLSSFPTQNDLSSGVAQASSMPPAVSLTRVEASSGEPRQPPNSPSLHRQAVMSTAPGIGQDQGIKPLIDLTEGKEKEDVELQKAIKLSLQEQTPSFGAGAFSQEDQDVSRALEASLLESSNSKRKRGDTWTDPQNPHDRERQGTRPVGLKNVGQTCWFSAVIQSLFYLPAFRHLVLSYSQQAPSSVSITPAVVELDSSMERDRKVVEFMVELRKLFALMLASHRKYVDPSRAVEILRGSIGTATANNQQDVSEFTHIILDWLEEAFKKKSPENGKEDSVMDQGDNAENADPNVVAADLKQPSTAADESIDVEGNPMKELFYGKLIVEGRLNGVAFKRPEAFGQFPVQVNTFADIHESLEKSTAHETIDSSLQSDSSQERWFTDLPPVLFLSLSRFQFNQERGLAEKIHNRLDFPEQIYMDRYMEDNKESTRGKREEVRVLKEQRDNLRRRLEQFTQFGSGEVKMPLKNILQSMLEFAASGSVSDGSADFVMSSSKEPAVASGFPSNIPPQLASNLMHVDSPCHSPKMTPASSLGNLTDAAAANREGADDSLTPMDIEDDSQMMPPPAAIASSGQPQVMGGVPGASVVPPPCPKNISEGEFQTFKDCLNRWQSEVSCDMTSLEGGIADIDSRISAMYGDPSLGARGFRLHAVMVHEGGVESGHYWAYVLDHKRKVWLKCNDNTVNEATWQELQKESVGGHSNTSAYSLVYINASMPEKVLLDVHQGEKEDCMEQGALESLLQTLPNDLAEFVNEDNKAFEEEKKKWIEEQENRKKEEAMQESITEIGGKVDSGDVMVVEERLTYVNTHANLSLEAMRQLLLSVEESTELDRSNGPALTERVIFQAKQQFNNRSDQFGLALLTGPTGSQPQPGLTESTPIKLESFIIYLLRNKVSEDLIMLALYEQFSLPSMDQISRIGATVKQHCDELLKRRQLSGNDEGIAQLKEWHQAYHMFRVSACCLVDGVDRFLEQKFDESLDLFTIAYNISRKLSERGPEGSMKTLRPSPILRYTSMALYEVHTATIKQFKLGERLDEAKERIHGLLCPALFLLDDWLKTTSATANDSSASVGQIIEKVRSEWCALLGDAETMATASNECLSEMLTLILESPPPKATAGDGTRLPKNRDHIDQQADLELADGYRQRVRLMEERNASGGDKW